MSDSTKPKSDVSFPFADAPAIVRAHQKDYYFESVTRTKLQEVIQLLKGQRFINTYPEEITVAAKALYLCLTTLRGSRTLGEEYTDLIYVSRNGKRLPKLQQRIGFIVSYALLPFLISKLSSKLSKLYPLDTDAIEEKDFTTDRKLVKILSNLSYKTAIDSIMNLHIALFYLRGQFYHLSKRIFGLRYVFGHSVDKNSSNGSYEVLGALIVVQLLFKVINKLNDLVATEPDSENSQSPTHDTELSNHALFGAPRNGRELDLSDSKILPFIPESSRKCMLCLEYMKSPSAPPCGHCFCWRCIIDWHQERPECPLCRQAFHQQEVIPLR